ncbi:BQ2448_6853 [Microbotryum intermedium]|uniref:BQ2448_6853 protein n=1 Tax=Microbotryum intermedium TaxID=269621 RepID=A0A238FNZ5_9BASI|nr:BQ2448_6853 [Microbotryum intermedium]
MARTLSDRSKESQPIKMLPIASTTVPTSTSTSTSAPVSAFGFAPAPPRPVFQTPVPLSHVAEKSAPVPSRPVQPQPQPEPQPPKIDQLVAPELQGALMFDPPSPFMRPQELADMVNEIEAEGLMLAPAALENITRPTTGLKGRNKKADTSTLASSGRGRGRGRGAGPKAKVGRKGKEAASSAKQGSGVGHHPNSGTVATRGRGRGGGPKTAVGRKVAGKATGGASGSKKARSSTKAVAAKAGVGAVAKKGKAMKIDAVPAHEAVPEATTSKTTSAIPAAPEIAVTEPTEKLVAEPQGRSKRARRVEPGRYAEPASPPSKKMKLGKAPKSQTKKGARRRSSVCTHPGCDKSFARNFNLNAHLDTHRGIRDYACHECGKLFSRRHDCTRHCVAVHNVDRETGKLEVLRVTPERAPHQKPGVQRQPSPFATSAAWANSGTAAARASGAGARKRKSNADGRKEGEGEGKKKKKSASTGKTAAAQRFKRNEPSDGRSGSPRTGFKTTGLPIRGRPRKTSTA